jgi:hypothetical protein
LAAEPGPELGALDDAGLAERLRVAESQFQEVRREMAPLERRLAEARGRRDVILTEQRRRERMATMAQRRGVREAVQAGQAVTLAAVAEGAGPGDAEDKALSSQPWRLSTGGSVGLGFSGARAQHVALTDGMTFRDATSLGELRSLYAAGWTFGQPGRPGVRVHLEGSKVERVVAPEEVIWHGGG